MEIKHKTSKDLNQLAKEIVEKSTNGSIRKIPSIVIPPDLVDVQGCVFKLYYGQHYIVLMGKSLFRQVETIRNDIKRYFNETGKGRSVNNIYFRFYSYIHSNPGLKFSYQLIIESDKPYQLLKTCQIELDKSLDDSHCCNMVFEPYINKDLQKPIKSRKFIWWINRGQYLNFRRWQKNRVIS